MVKRFFALILPPLAQLGLAFRPTESSLLAYLNPGNTKESADTTPDGPRATVAEGHEKDADVVPDCHAKRKMISNWKVDFQSIESIEQHVNSLMRVQTTKEDPQDVWNLAELDENNHTLVGVHMAADVWFKAEEGCEALQSEDLRLSTKISCEEEGIPVDKEPMHIEGHHAFRLKTLKMTSVQKREEKSEQDGLLGDWTFKSGDFKIVKADNDTMDYEQKFWTNPVPHHATLKKKGELYANTFEGELKVLGSECKKFKLRNCPMKLCENSTSQQCQPVNEKEKHGTVTLVVTGTNEMTRTVQGGHNELKEFEVKRSFTPMDAEMDAFVCVKLNSSWYPIRGFSYKQLTSASENVKEAEKNRGVKVFESKDFGREWIQEKHMMEDGILSADGWTPPWKKSIQASVEWKRAQKCPEKFPLCYKDGDCVLADCNNGCEWSRAPSVDSKPEVEFNYIAGADGFGTKCDIDFEAVRGGAPGLAFAVSLLAFLQL